MAKAIKSIADKIWEMHLKNRPKWMIPLIGLYKKEVVDIPDLDTAGELHWYSMAIGWGIAKGMTVDDAYEFASLVSGVEDRL